MARRQPLGCRTIYYVILRVVSLRVLPALALLLLTLGSTLLAGCRACLPQSDAARAAEERKEVHKQLNSSLLVLPYRGIKTVIRASAIEPPPPQIAEVIRLSQEASAQLSIEQTEVVGQSKQLVALASALYHSGAILMKEDEDRYPLIWDVAKAGPLPAAWYGAPAEHLLVGIFDLIVYAAGKQKPLIDWVYYEFDRATPQPGWPLELTLIAQQFRGIMFMLGEKHYAADEELTGYLTGLGSMSAEQRQQLLATTSTGQKISGEDYHKGLRALGHATRSFNRFALKRDELGYADLEATLKLVQELGMDNELTDWAQISLALHKKDYAKAGKLLDHLAQSPFLFEEDRAEVKRCAESMTKLDSGFVLFGRTRAQLVVARALLARIGGIKTVLATLAVLIGPERSAKLARPVLLLWGTTAVLADDAKRTGAEAVGQGKQLGHKGYHYLRDKVQQLKD